MTLSSVELLNQKVLQVILDELPESEREMPLVLWLNNKLRAYKQKEKDNG